MRCAATATMHQADRRSVLLRSRLLIAEHVTRTTANVLSVHEIVARVHALSPQVWLVCPHCVGALGAMYRSAAQHIPRGQQSTVVAHGSAHCCAALKTTRKGTTARTLLRSALARLQTLVFVDGSHATGMLTCPIAPLKAGGPSHSIRQLRPSAGVQLSADRSA